MSAPAPACNVCGGPPGSPVYRSADNASITTMNKVIPGRTEVYFCGACGHLQTTELPDLDRYYASEYEINLATDDDDQLYKVVDGRPVYRAEHQAGVLMEKVALPENARVLDYGCAKAATLRKIVAARPGIVPMAFDVTDKYVPFWKKFVADGDWSISRPRPEWRGTLDAVLSFYALEHVKDPRGFLREVGALLKPGGIFYFIVPNAYANIADFVVADHINHFSEPSLRALLAACAFEALDVDADSHDAAFVVVARKTAGAPGADNGDVAALRPRALEMARFWDGAAGRVRAFEAGLPRDARRAIYGAGFYGNFIASVLGRLDAVECFVDQNVHLQGRTVLGKPIVPPAALDPAVRAIFVGLNPRSARKIVDEIAAWRGQPRDYLFL
jgi:SAM-dependent methyltransferase